MAFVREIEENATQTGCQSVIKNARKTEIRERSETTT